jgi:WAS family protein 1
VVEGAESDMEGYQIPIIPNDLRREETIVHVVGALTQLTKVSNDIFDKIGGKCDEFQSKIAGINQRIDVANAKLETLRDSKKATVVFSSAR